MVLGLSLLQPLSPGAVPRRQVPYAICLHAWDRVCGTTWCTVGGTEVGGHADEAKFFTQTYQRLNVEPYPLDPQGRIRVGYVSIELRDR
eukprot:2806641-Rhodomonas_salina.1